MRFIKKAVFWIVVLVALVYISLATMQQVPFFQEKFSQQAAFYLTKKLNTEVRIRNVEFGFFNQLILKDVYILDLSGEVILQAKRISAGFEFFPLLKNQWRFNSIQLFTFQFNLSKETDNAPFNIQHIVDVIAQKDSLATSSNIDLQISQLNLRLGNFSYRVKNKIDTSESFNINNVYLSDISSKIHIHKLNNQDLELQISKLSFKEQSGIKLKNLNFDLVADENEAKIKRLKVELDRSSIMFSDIIVNYNLLQEDNFSSKPVTFRLKLENSNIYPKELSPFFPVLSNFDDKISLEGVISGDANNLSIKNFYFRYFNQIMFNINAELYNIFNFTPESFFIRGNVTNSFFSYEGIERLMTSLSLQRFEVPHQLKRLNNIRFEGNITGSLNDLSALGVWNTDLGIIQTNVKIGKTDIQTIKGQISSESLNLEQLLNNKDYGDMAFNIYLDAKQNPDKKYSGIIDATLSKLDFKGYSYRNLNFNGFFSPESFEGGMSLSCPEGKISGNGLWIFKGKDSKIDFHAMVSELQLDKLNFTKKYKNPLLSFELIADLTGDDIDNLIGSVSLNNLKFENGKDSYLLNNIHISSTASGQEKRFQVDSEIFSGKIWGNYSFNNLLTVLKQTVSRYLPALVKPESNYFTCKETDFSFKFTINNMTDLSKIFDLPFSFNGMSEISGGHDGEIFHLDFASPQAFIMGSNTDSLKLTLSESNKVAHAEITGTNLQKRNIKVKFKIDLDASNDKINTLFHWGNSSTNYRGDLKLTTSFSRIDDYKRIRIETNIHNTNMVFNDSIWTLHPATVVIDSSNIKIDHFYAEHNDQFIKINGVISDNPAEELTIDLNRINLEYIFQSLSIPALEFGGVATGFAIAQDLFKTRKMETELDIIDFSFNNTYFGHLYLTGTWDDVEQGVFMDGYAIKNDTSFVDVTGFIFPVREEISFDFKARNADARFLRKYLDKIVLELTGNLSGNLRLFGWWNTPTVEGDVFASNCRFGIGFLNTFYTFSDSVKCLPDEILVKNISVYDEKGNKSIANGYVKHNLFQDFSYKGEIAFTNFMVFNPTKSMNPMFHGIAYGNGTASIYGTEDLLNIDVKMQNTENTKVTLNFVEELDIEDYNFIRFVSVNKSFDASEKNKDIITKPVPSGLYTGPEVKFDLILNATPKATIDMIMDPISGDKISGSGSGNLQIQYGTKTPLKVLGNFIIEHGKYNFSLQQFFVRNFDIQEGSSVTFRGDPYTAELNINAYSIVNANLEDLDPQLIESKRSARSSVPVKCILLLTGPLDRPNIGFDMDLPGATDELVRQVKSYIRTEDMLNRQIGYLLVLSRFYTPPENMRDNNSVTNSNWSYLTSTLSSQISNMLGLLSDNFQLGTKFHQSNIGAQTNTEFELLLSSQLLNNRLIVNGNFGYINNPYTSRQTSIPLIGDFDLEYKLTTSGDIRLKGFNHYNYRNYYSIAPEMTQGLGILFRKDFSHWLDLFRRKKTDEKK